MPKLKGGQAVALGDLVIGTRIGGQRPLIGVVTLVDEDAEEHNITVAVGARLHKHAGGYQILPAPVAEYVSGCASQFVKVQMPEDVKEAEPDGKGKGKK